MIKESIIITTNRKGKPHVVPMGVKFIKKKIFISPFIPSQTFLNLKEYPYAVINYIDDVGVFVGCLFGTKKYKMKKTKKIKGFYLQEALTYIEIRAHKLKENKIRPEFECKILNETMLKPFQGFNRAQAAVIEAAILASRLGIISIKKINKEIGYLQNAINKTAGDKEKFAWNQLLKRINNFKKK